MPELEDNARVIALSAPLVRDYVPATTNTAPRCEFRITFDGSDVPIAGASRRFVADRLRGECAPAVSSLDTWVTVTVDPGSTPQHTTGQVTYGATADALSRSGHFVIGEQPISVRQGGAGSCLTQNGSFDHDVSSWTVTPSPFGPAGTVAWSTRDVAGSPTSGSAVLSTRNGYFAIQRCVPVQPSSSYTCRSSVFMPPGQSATPNDNPVLQSVSFFDTTDCTGEDLGAGSGRAYIPGTWLQVDSRYTSQAHSQSAKIVLAVNVAGPFTAHFDDVYFCRTGAAATASSSEK